MNRELVLVASLYNGGILSVLDFIVQCSEMYKDDVFNWEGGKGLKALDRFRRYAARSGGFKYKLFRSIRNAYVHSFDENVDSLHNLVTVVTLLDIKNACDYFGIEFESGRVLESLQLMRTLIEHMRNLEELDGSKKS